MGGAKYSSIVNNVLSVATKIFSSFPFFINVYMKIIISSVVSVYSSIVDERFVDRSDEAQPLVSSFGLEANEFSAV